ncbi:hypothetical protein TanjilG_00050 [Lupinus angustifolius]|uniref:Transcription repressor n=1 Tax=Lupinus angustifolius TaxID=3871 RepID=A0A394DB25_LUPAN|nr:PREDICTED: transcription repressor OFP13-like [Lupinus angustifolius]OIW16541.1 hypothetical protein TanjilG_00050 [Lupinus angustifolius]
MKFSFLKNNTNASTRSTSSWAWPSCHQPRTLSFRTNNNNNKEENAVMFKTINSAYLESESSKSFFTEESRDEESASFSTCSEEETMIRGLRSDRLFFEPDETSSILEAKLVSPPFKDSMVMSMVSKDPYVDFRESMEEMVKIHGVKDWESLEELLCWYLKVNGKSNYPYILGAFVDLLVGLGVESASSLSPSTTSHFGCSTSSPVSSSSSSMYSSRCSTLCASCLEEKEKVNAPCSSLLLEQVKEEITHEDNEA